MQPTQPSFPNNNNYSPQKQPNFRQEPPQAAYLTPPKDPIHDHG